MEMKDFGHIFCQEEHDCLRLKKVCICVIFLQYRTDIIFNIIK